MPVFFNEIHTPMNAYNPGQFEYLASPMNAQNFNFRN